MKPGAGVYPASESEGRLRFNTGQTVTSERAYAWHLSAFMQPENKFQAQPCGEVVVHPRAVQTQGMDFADRVGRQLAGMVTERQKP